MVGGGAVGAAATNTQTVNKSASSESEGNKKHTNLQPRALRVAKTEFLSSGRRPEAIFGASGRQPGAEEASGGLRDRFWEPFGLICHSFLMFFACVSAFVLRLGPFWMSWCPPWPVLDASDGGNFKKIT